MGKAETVQEFDEIKWRAFKSFNCLGVEIGVRSDAPRVISKLNRRINDILPVEWKTIRKKSAAHWFSVIEGSEMDVLFKVYKNSELLSAVKTVEEILSVLESHIRLTIAEFAENFVFLHAGVVGWNGKAIIIPGKSFSGKTTLVAELVKRNFDYFSDEYAVIDAKGIVHPFPKKLSIRGIIDDYRQLDFAVEELGGVCATEPLPIGFLLVTEYNKKIKKPHLKLHSTGEGVMASVANSISVRQNPKFVLGVLSTVANQAVILEAKRGNAKEFVDVLLNFLENHEN